MNKTIRRLTEEHKRKIGLSKLGKKRKPFSKEWKMRISIGQSKLGRKGPKSPSWKGDKVGYKGVHHWVVREFGPAKTHECGICKGSKNSKRNEWANLDGKYTRNPETWMVMCKTCHVAHDQEKFQSYTPTEKTKAKMRLVARNRKRNKLGIFI